MGGKEPFWANKKILNMLLGQILQISNFLGSESQQPSIGSERSPNANRPPDFVTSGCSENDVFKLK
jgi:hypothetical protein